MSNVYKRGNAEKKAGDDYPARVYVVFAYDMQTAGLWKRAKYEAAKLVYGEYPPDSTVNYIWANRSHDRRTIDSPYTESAKLIVLKSGEAQVGQWVNEEVHVLNDYRAAFGKEPPATASLAIMVDSDNTGESAQAHFDNIAVLPAKSR